MAVRGTKLKPDGQKRNRVKPTFEWTDIPAVPYAGKVPVAAQSSWPTATKQWWRVVTRMPHCVLWTDADWRFAYDTAVLSAAFHDGDLRVATEFRQREKTMGTTFDSRRDLRIRYVEPSAAIDDEGDGTVASMADYKASVGA